MSISEKLVLLNQDIESAEAKIIEKGGSVTNNGSSNLADNIDTIPTGSGESALYYSKSPIQVAYDVILPETLVFDAGNLRSGTSYYLSVRGFFTGVNAEKCENLKHIVLKGQIGTVESFINNNLRELIDIDLTETDTSKFYSYYNAFQNGNLKSIFGELNFSGVGDSVVGIFNGCSNLEDVIFAENNLNRAISLSSSSKLTTDSLVSIANGLVAGNYTLTLHAISKANCNTIMGYVDNTKGYDVFVADESGTVTLSEFITITKGWSLA